jgi:1,4-alpha-glucan branching enzyme
MKTKNIITPVPNAGHGRSGTEVPVRIHFQDPKAKSVCVAGTFNDWHPGATEMVKMSRNLWEKEIVLEPGDYQYRLVVDGVWQADPACSESVSNGYGECNSVLHVVKPQTKETQPSARMPNASNPQAIMQQPVRQREQRDYRAR